MRITLGHKPHIAVFALIVFSLFHSNCTNHGSDASIFKLLTPSETGVTFSNEITESHEFNIINYQDFYSGSGVSIGDVNNDGLPDLFFTGNMVENRLYLNKGDLKFEDITESAGLRESDYSWCTGSTMVDINDDGWLDIYVGYSGLLPEEQRKNKLWINLGDNTFKNEAKVYGIDDPGYAVNAHFFDMDKDGDLDMYLVNQGPEKNVNFNMTVSRDIPNEFCGDKLFRNDGDSFIDITIEAGIYSSLIGFGHGAAVGDVNDDGWDDIYVCNDFFEHDYLYINQKNGTFTEQLDQSIEHTSNYSMGNDMADINNDGFLDIMVLDMIAEDYRRQKRMMSGMDAMLFWRAYDQGYLIQYMANSLQLNNGNLQFSEIAHMAGVSNTDWSWGPLLADFDGDGYKDLFIANGLRKDIRNIDWARKYNDLLDVYHSYELFSPEDWDYLLSALPSEKIPNYIYKSNQDLTFSNVAQTWGLEQPSFSNGSAYGDLDNDGDLDLVVNNVDEPAFVYENLLNRRDKYHYLKIKLNGPENNSLGLGTKVYLISQSGKMQMQQVYLTRGYRSSVDPNIVFGLAQDSIVTSVEILWPDNSKTKLESIPSNQTIVVDYDESPKSLVEYQDKEVEKTLFHSYDSVFGIDYNHQENILDPYQYQPLLPYKLSELGPAVTVADFNGDELDDIFIGNARGKRSYLYLQSPGGSFSETSEDLWKQDKKYEDVDSEALDIDQDGDLDLYVVSGGYSISPNHIDYQDRLYLNDGGGIFTRDTLRVPRITTSGSTAIAGDYDLDGDTDLLVTGRQIPQRYPLPADTYILKNEGGFLKNVTSEIAPGLLQCGMVTDGLWSDVDNDDDLDIVLVGEWMNITIYHNKEGLFNKISAGNGLSKSSGWWNCIKQYDFDGDGDEDFVVGNLGLNYRYKASQEYPFEIFSSDFNNDDVQDIILSYYENRTLYPLENLERSLRQMPELGETIDSHDQYSEMDLEDIYGRGPLKSAANYKVYTFESSLVENLGDGQFALKPLPKRAQISNINDILINDYDHDGHVDLLIAGNMYDAEEETVRIDAGVGLYLTGDGKGSFEPIAPQKSGLYIRGDVNHLSEIKIHDKNFIISIRNDGFPGFTLIQESVKDPRSDDEI